MARTRSSPARKAPASSQGHKPLCRNLPRTIPDLSAAVRSNPLRARAIINNKTKWLNGTVLHYCFFGGTSHYAVPKAQADAIRAAFAKWKAVGIGLEFTEVTQLNEAEVRIGYSTADGSSASMVGRDVLTVPLTEPTTVYGWDLTNPVRQRHCAARARTRARHGTRAPEPVRRNQMARAGGVRLARQAAEQLGPRHDVPQHPGEAQHAAGPGIDVGSRLDHGIRVRTRTDRRARDIRRQRPHATRHSLDSRQAVGSASGIRR